MKGNDTKKYENTKQVKSLSLQWILNHSVDYLIINESQKRDVFGVDSILGATLLDREALLQCRLCSMYFFKDVLRYKGRGVKFGIQVVIRPKAEKNWLI